MSGKDIQSGVGRGARSCVKLFFEQIVFPVYPVEAHANVCIRKGRQDAQRHELSEGNLLYLQFFKGLHKLGILLLVKFEAGTSVGVFHLLGF